MARFAHPCISQSWDVSHFGKGCDLGQYSVIFLGQSLSSVTANGCLLTAFSGSDEFSLEGDLVVVGGRAPIS